MAAVEAGVDALGFNMYENSPRFVTAEVAWDIVRQLPPFIASVGVFVNPPRDRVEAMSRQIGFDLLQFHGDEDDAFCESFARPYIKALRVAQDMDIAAETKRFSGARAILLDTKVEGMYGGTGKTFEWKLASSDVGKPIILAGGLTPDNVTGAIRLVRPWAVDVSGGVESEQGIKDPRKIEAFVKSVRASERD